MAGQRQTDGNVGTQSHGALWVSRATECDRSKFHVTEGQCRNPATRTRGRVAWRTCFSPHALRSGPSRAGAGSASPWSRRFQCERHQTNMKRSTQTPISQKLPAVIQTGASGSRYAVSFSRRSPLNRLDCSGGHDCPLSTPCLPLERSRSEAGGRENATQSLASTDRRDVCGDGHRWRLEEMRFRWIRGDRSFRYAARLDGSSEPLDVEGRLMAT